MEEMGINLEDDQIFEYIRKKEEEKATANVIAAIFLIILFGVFMFIVTCSYQYNSKLKKQNEIDTWNPQYNNSEFHSREIDDDIKNLMKEYDGTDEYKEKTITQLEQENSKDNYLIYVVEIILLGLAIVIAVVLCYSSVHRFARKNDVLITHGICISKERYRSRYRNSDTLDVELEDGYVLYKQRVSASVYNSVKSGESVLAVRLKGSGDICDGIYPDIS